METSEIIQRFENLLNFSHETEWLEFKHNDAFPQAIGEYISALSNSAGLLGESAAYIVWGIKDGTLEVVGTTFKPHEKKVGNEELENWLSHNLSPRVDFQIHEFSYKRKRIVIFEIQPCEHTPVRFRDVEYLRVGSYKKRLSDHPEKERKLWRRLEYSRFETHLAKRNLSDNDVLALVDYPSVFDLLGQPLPDNKSGIIDRLCLEKLVERESIKFGITNLGALLFARRLSDFRYLSRKASRVVEYAGDDRVKRVREHLTDRGYASGFTSLVELINERLPMNEVMGKALRKDVKMYPELAVRELLANTLVHQDLSATGQGPMVEIFANRIEFTNPGKPLIDLLRFLDAPPRSRNELLAAFMRRLGMCEEVGSGIDKVVHQVELYQLPAPEFRVRSGHTKVTLFGHRKLSEMSAEDKVRACYLHACLEFVSGRKMTNSSLRRRFGIEERNYSTASRIIADTMEEKLVRQYDPRSASKKFAKYVPFWA